ncbi:MAG: hypothetical protein JXA06_12020 [Bacteroidetes bacterium]|nr:hypothetical protein [Bacteroidota bacterium]
MLKRFVKSKTSISMLEIAFIVVTFCLSIYSFIFSDDFTVKQVVNKDVIQRAFWTDPNYLGSIIAIGIIVSFFYFMNRTIDKMVIRILFLTVAIMGFIVLGLLASRGAFLAAIVPTFYILYKKINSIKNFAFVVLFVVVAVTALSSSGYFDGLIMRIASGDTTGSDRTIIWELSLNKFFQSDMPMILLGGGTNNANILVGKAVGLAIYSPHNNFLAVLYDYGIIGMSVFLYIFFIWITKNLNNILLISLVLYFGLVCFTLVPLMYYPYCYLLVLFEGYVSYEDQRKLHWRQSENLRKTI